MGQTVPAAQPAVPIDEDDLTLAEYAKRKREPENVRKPKGN